jgi:hypothetical protein
MGILFWVVGGAIVMTLVRFLFLWAGLRTLLREILRVPMVGAFERIPDEIGRLFGGYLYSQRPRHGHLAAAAWALPVGEREQLAREIAEQRPNLAWVFGHPLPTKYPETSGSTDEADRLWLACRLQKAAAHHLTELPTLWGQQNVDEAFGAARPTGAPSTGDRTGSGEQTGDRSIPSLARHAPLAIREVPGPAYIRAAELYVACYVVLYLGPYFAQLRKLVFAFVLPAALLLFAAASYPFQPNRPRLDALAVVVIAAAISIVYVLYEINRDGLISRITRTPPDRFSFDAGFFSSIMKYILPLVLILAAQLFGLFRFILEPLFALFQ